MFIKEYIIHNIAQYIEYTYSKTYVFYLSFLYIYVLNDFYFRYDKLY